MTLESNFWHTVRDGLSPFGMLKRVEDGTDTGTGDVFYCLRRPKPGSIAASGWIELKCLDNYPARRMTPITIDHLTKEQVLFAEEWAKTGGRAWLLLRATPWYLLFDPAGARGLFEKAVVAADGPAVAKVAAMGKLPVGPLLRALTEV